jgi:hypothetical protein
VRWQDWICPTIPSDGAGIADYPALVTLNVKFMENLRLITRITSFYFYGNLDAFEAADFPPKRLRVWKWFRCQAYCAVSFRWLWQAVGKMNFPFPPRLRRAGSITDGPLGLPPPRRRGASPRRAWRWSSWVSPSRRRPRIFANRRESPWLARFQWPRGACR